MNLDAIPTLTATGEAPFDQQTLIGKWTVLYFYPKDSTPGCTREGQDFRDLGEKFTEYNAQIFGVSRDSLASHQRFKEKQNFSFELISDPEEKLCRVFDVIREKKNFGKTYMGIERSTFLLNPQGEVVRQWRKVKVPGHAEDVLCALAEEVAKQG